jgi:glucan 1,3-beta-glucosidase
MPTDPREAVGMCASLGVSGGAPFDGTYPEPWMTGGAGAGDIPPSVSAQYPWPPSSISSAGAAGSLLPTYTPTGTIPTLPPPSLTATPTTSVDVGDGWFDPQDTAGAMTPVAGCSYPNAWDATDVPVPPVCGGGAPTAAPARR